VSLLVISCSLDPDSRSRVMARHSLSALAERGAEAELIDLQDWPLPLCDGGSTYDAPNVAPLTAKITAADGVLLAAPVYNFDVNAAAKNLVELTDKAWQDQIVGFLLSAGGQSSYMSVMGFANSLMLDFRCLILPRFVYATKQAFDDEQITDPLVSARIGELVEKLIAVSSALRDTQ
jgi:NAD(P)H-dependent FMN reductase